MKTQQKLEALAYIDRIYFLLEEAIKNLETTIADYIIWYQTSIQQPYDEKDVESKEESHRSYHAKIEMIYLQILSFREPERKDFAPKIKKKIQANNEIIESIQFSYYSIKFLKTSPYFVFNTLCVSFCDKLLKLFLSLQNKEQRSTVKYKSLLKKDNKLLKLLVSLHNTRQPNAPQTSQRQPQPKFYDKDLLLTILISLPIKAQKKYLKFFEKKERYNTSYKEYQPLIEHYEPFVSLLSQRKTDREKLGLLQQIIGFYIIPKEKIAELFQNIPCHLHFESLKLFEQYFEHSYLNLNHLPVELEIKENYIMHLYEIGRLNFIINDLTSIQLVLNTKRITSEQQDKVLSSIKYSYLCDNYHGEYDNIPLGFLKSLFKIIKESSHSPLNSLKVFLSTQYMSDPIFKGTIINDIMKVISDQLEISMQELGACFFSLCYANEEEPNKSFYAYRIFNAILGQIEPNERLNFFINNAPKPMHFSQCGELGNLLSLLSSEDERTEILKKLQLLLEPSIVKETIIFKIIVQTNSEPFFIAKVDQGIYQLQDIFYFKKINQKRSYLFPYRASTALDLLHLPYDNEHLLPSYITCILHFIRIHKNPTLPYQFIFNISREISSSEKLINLVDRITGQGINSKDLFLLLFLFLHYINSHYDLKINNEGNIENNNFSAALGRTRGYYLTNMTTYYAMLCITGQEDNHEDFITLYLNRYINTLQPSNFFASEAEVLLKTLKDQDYKTQFKLINNVITTYEESLQNEDFNMRGKNEFINKKITPYYMLLLLLRTKLIDKLRQASLSYIISPVKKACG